MKGFWVLTCSVWFIVRATVPCRWRHAWYPECGGSAPGGPSQQNTGWLHPAAAQLLPPRTELCASESPANTQSVGQTTSGLMGQTEKYNMVVFNGISCSKCMSIPCWEEAAAWSERWQWLQLKPGCYNCLVPSDSFPDPEEEERTKITQTRRRQKYLIL